MELSRYLQILLRYKWLILLSSIGFALIAVSMMWIFPTDYTATAILRIELTRYDTASYPQLIYADRLMNTYVKIAESSPVNAELQDRLSLDPDRPADIKVEIIPETELIQITVTDSDRFLARDAANTMATILVNTKQPSDGQITLIEPAKLQEISGLRDLLIYAMLGLIFGGVIGIGGAFVLDNLDTRVRTKEDIKNSSGLPLIGEIPTIKRIVKNHFWVEDPEYYGSIRRLRTFLFSKEATDSIKSLLITSALPKEGKSTLTANLGIGIAVADRNVVLIDADLHFPSVHKYFNIENAAGLSDILAGTHDAMDVIQKTEINNLSIITAGSPTLHSTELLGIEKMTLIMEALKNTFEIILIDSPTFLGVPDAAVLAPLVDGVVVVAMNKYVKKTDLAETCDQLRKINANLIGIVSNRVVFPSSNLFNKYYHSANKFQNFNNNNGKYETATGTQNQSKEVRNIGHQSKNS